MKSTLSPVFSLHPQHFFRYGHALSNVIAQVGDPTYAYYKPYHTHNDWQIRVARALNPATRREMCTSELDASTSDGVFCGGVRNLINQSIVVYLQHIVFGAVCLCGRVSQSFHCVLPSMCFYRLWWCIFLSDLRVLPC